jgi:hypothetical protein
VPAERLTIAEFQAAIRAGRFVPGDAVLYCWRRPTPLAWGIRRAQVRALADLVGLGKQGTNGTYATHGTYGGDAEELADWQAEAAARIGAAAHYTHAGMIVDAEISAEMTSPRARLITWADRLRVGDRLLVVRPVGCASSPCAALRRNPGPAEAGTPNPAMQAAAAAMTELARGGTRYPWRELLTYWFATLPHAIAADHFAEYFCDRERNVCSGAIWDAWVDARAVDPLGDDEMPEAWYPGRMAMDGKYLRRVAEVRIVGTDEADETDKAKEKTTMNWKAKIADAVLVLGLLLALTGCRGGLFGGAGADAGLTREIKLYEIHFATGANSIANIGNAGTQSPMYQSPEAATETDGAGPYFTGGHMPASGGTNAGTAQGKYVQQNVNDANKRSAETDASAAAQLMAGNTQSTGTQTPAQVQRQGTATPTSTTTANPEHNPALQLNPATALTGQGTAQVTNPTSTLAGASSTPGAVTGGTGAATGQTGQTSPTGQTGLTGQTGQTTSTAGELVTTVTANPDGSKTVTTDTGTSYTGKIADVFPPTGTGTETTAVLLLSDGTPVKLRATGDNALRLGQ